MGRVFRAAFFVFAFEVGVVDGHPRIGIGVGGDIGDGTTLAASDRFPIGGALLPGRSGQRHAAAAPAGAVAVPYRLARPRSAGAERALQAGAADRDHVGEEAG